MKTTALLFATVLVLPTVAVAQTYAITGGKVHTVSDAGTLDDATVVIADGRVVAVGTDVAVPDGAEVIDATNKVVTPGFVPAYSHLGLVEIGLVDETVDSYQIADRFAAAVDVTDAFNPASTLIPIMRVEGITRALTAPTVSLWALARVPGARTSLIAGQGAWVDLSGTEDSVVQPRVAMFVELGETGAALTGGSRTTAMLEVREALIDARDYAEEEGADWLERDRALSRLDLQALGPVIDGSIPLVARVERASDIRAAMQLADEFDLKLVILGGAEAWMLADELAEAGVPVIFDPVRNLPDRFERLGSRLEAAALLNEAGVTIAFSSSDEHNDRNVRQTAGNAVAYGLPYDAALAALTRNPAYIYGVEEYGSLEPGAVADIVVWDGDPLEVTTYADAVFINGEKIPMESRQTKLRDRYLKLDRELPHAYTKP